MGLWAVHGAELVPGIDAVLDAVGFAELLRTADVVVTGEGRLDQQTAEGKVVAGVIEAGTPTLLRRAGRQVCSSTQLGCES